MTTVSTPITKIVKSTLGNSDGLLQWANRIGLQGTSMEAHRARTQRAGVGAHDVLRRAANVIRDGGDELDDETWALAVAEARSSRFPKANALAAWIEETHPLFVSTEKNVHGDGFHGRLDYTRMCRDCGRLIVGDLKPSGPFPDAHLQVAAYMTALTTASSDELELFGPKSLDVVCRGEIIVYGDAGYRAYRGLADVADWKALMGTHEALNRIRGRMLAER